MQKSPFVLIVTGPTASGKSALAELLAQQLNGNIINADVGQFYTPLTIGTAKPDWQKSPIPSYLFDSITEPIDISIMQYRANALSLINSLSATGILPIIVGGSLFYIKSLFYPPSENSKKTLTENIILDISKSSHELWTLLNSIDPERARVIHINDRYRIIRALTIWYSTGKKPSEMRPLYSPCFSALIVCIEPSRDILYDAINKRTRAMMLDQGWIAEAESLVGTPWQPFIEKKGLIGYEEIFTWIQNGKPSHKLNEVIALIAQQTRQYAKRQLVFLQKFKKDIIECAPTDHLIQINTLSSTTAQAVNNIIQIVKKTRDETR